MKTVISFCTLLLLLLTSCTSTTKQDNPASNTSLNGLDLNTSAQYQETVHRGLDTNAKQLYITAKSGLSLRKGTNLKSEKILTIPYGSQVQHLSSPEHTTMTVAGIVGDMVQVNYQGATGFVFSGYLSTLSPPLEDETAKEYAARLSTPEKKIKVSTVKNTKGESYGLTTSIELPAKSWGEAYLLAQTLFDIPKSITVDLTNSSKDLLVNAKKRPKTKIDQVTIERDSNANIKTVTYSYALRDYNRTVTITKNDGVFTISEVEVSQ